MNQSFNEAIVALNDTTSRFINGTVDAWTHSREREAAIIKGIIAMAAGLQVTLKPIHAINPNGEIMVAIDSPAWAKPPHPTFGEFATWLNVGTPRMGIIPCKIHPDNAWCYVNHFDAEKIVQAYAAAHPVQ